MEFVDVPSGLVRRILLALQTNFTDCGLKSFGTSTVTEYLPASAVFCGGDEKSNVDWPCADSIPKTDSAKRMANENENVFRK